MTEVAKKWLREQARFNGIFETAEDGESLGNNGRSDDNAGTEQSRWTLYKGGRFAEKIPLTSMPIFEECRKYIEEAYESGCDGGQRLLFEEELAKFMGLKYAVAVNSGQAALQLALKLAAEKYYGTSSHIVNTSGNGGCLQGKKVFCSDLTESSMVNPIVFEGGEPVFIDCNESYLSMDPEVLSMAFEKYPDVKIVVLSEPYGFSGDVLGVRNVCFEHDALLIECAGDSFGASYWVGEGEPDDNGVWAKAGTIGDYCVLDFGKGKLIGENGGAVVTRDYYESKKVRYWAGNASVDTPWNQHEEFGYNCVLGDFDAALLRGELVHIEEIISAKKSIYDRYFEKLDSEMAYIVSGSDHVKPNYWMTVMTSESNLCFSEVRNDRKYLYECTHGTAAPMEIYDVLQAFNIDCAIVYKPMSMQPIYRNCEHFTLDGAWRQYESFSNDTFSLRCDRAREFYESGIVLPSSDMSEEAQGKVIDIIYACYGKPDLDRMKWVDYSSDHAYC